MISLAYSLLAIWFVGFGIFAGIALNDMRVVLNNLAPGTSILKSRRALDYSPFQFKVLGHAVTPEDLTETGRRYLQRAKRHHRITLAWMIIGFALFAAVFSFIPNR